MQPLCAVYWKKLHTGRGKIIFSPPECPEQLWSPPSLLCKGYRDSFPEVKWLGSGVEHSPPPNAEVKN